MPISSASFASVLSPYFFSTLAASSPSRSWSRCWFAMISLHSRTAVSQRMHTMMSAVALVSADPFFLFDSCTLLIASLPYHVRMHDAGKLGGFCKASNRDKYPYLARGSFLRRPEGFLLTSTSFLSK